MKCPDCGDTETQQRLGAPDGQPDHDGYRCARCGRLYAANGTDRRVRVAKSGMSSMLTVEDVLSSAELRQWLKNRGCRVGTTFEPTAGRFAFFVYASQPRIVRIIGQHGDFTAEVRARL